MFLATTALSEFWKNDQDVLFLGKWCLRYDRRREWENIHYKVLDYPWDDKLAYERARDYCNRIYGFLLTNLTECLNTIHNVEHSRRYWEIIIGPWLLHFIHAFYDRYICLKYTFERYPNLDTLCLSERSYLTPIDLTNFKSLSTDDPYNLQLYSQLIKLMGYTKPERDYKVATKKVSLLGHGMSQQIKMRAKNILKKLAPFFNALGGRLSSKLIGQMNIRELDVLKICLKSGFKIWPLLPIEMNISQYPTNNEVRKKLLNITDCDTNDPFQKIIIQALPCNFPVSYIEGYSTIRNYILKVFVGSTKTIIDSVGWFLNEPFKVLAAEKSESGTILLGVQHGGVYGIARDMPIEDHEVSIADFFFSWGWKREDCMKVIPMPNPKLSHLRKRSIHRKIPDKGSILHISTIYSRYLEFFRSVPIGPQVMDYLENQYVFIQSLPLRIHQMMIIRPYSWNAYGWQQSQRFKEKFPNIKIDDHSKSFYERLEMCRLVVCSDNQTTFLESMVFNVPTLLFIDPKQWKICADAAPFYQELERVGILSWEPREAALKVIEIYDDTIAWWFSNEIQSVRKDFISRFALGSENWLRIWVDKLVHL